MYQDYKISEKFVSWSITTQETGSPPTEPSLVSFGAGIAGAYNGTLTTHPSLKYWWNLNFTGLYYNYDAINADQTSIIAEFYTGEDYLMSVDA